MIARLRGLVALLVIVGLVLGGPWLLVRHGDWPITSIPGLDDVRHSFDTVVSDQMVFGVLTLAAWVVWALFMVSLVVEAVAAIRCRDAPRITLAAPMQRGARVLVAMIVLAFAVHQSAASVAGAARGPAQLPPPRSPVIAEFRSLPETAAGDPGSSHSAEVRPMSDGLSNLAPTTITVDPGDSAWSIAEALLGDGMRWRELWDLNRTRPQPDGRAWIDPQLIRPGWILALPAEAQRPTGPAAAPAQEPAPAPAVHVVERGDTLSGIAERYLGASSRFVELFDLNRGSLQPDGRTLDDPAIILPGWSISIPPTLSAAPAPSAQPTSPMDNPTNDEVTVQSDEESPATTNENPSAEPDTSDPDGTTASSTPSAVSPPTSLTAPTTTATPAAAEASSPPTALDPTDEGSEVSETWPSTAALLAGVSGAIALASALLVRLRRVRRRSTSRGVQLRPSLDEENLTTEAAVVAAADLPLVRWAGQSLAELFAGLRPPHLQSIPQAVELSDSTGLEILWSAPNRAAPAPWSLADGGWTWRLPYDPDAPVPVEALPAALPSLVTIGRRDGRQLLVNLEAFGSVAVRGDVERVTAFLRSVAAELALGDDLADAYVSAVNVDVPMSSDRLWIGDIDEAIQRVESFSASVRDAFRPTGAESSHAFRSGPNGAHLEVAVVIASLIDDTNAARLVQSIGANQGVAVVVASDVPANASVRINADGSAVLDPLGVSFEAVGLPADSARQITALTARIDNRPEEFSTAPLPLDPDGLPPPNGSMTILPASSNGHGPSTMNSTDPVDTEHPADGVRSPLDAAMVVRVLGTPRVPDRPDLKRRELILTAFLACRGGQVNASAVQDALWNGQPVQGKTVWNLVGRTRTALGQLPDGTWALPPSDRNRRMKGLADGVTTDLAILRHLYDEAQQTPSSRAIELLWQGLELVEGPPFDADGYDWAHHGTQDVAEASSLIERSAAQLVELALNVDDVERARGAITQGLRGLPGDEVLYRLRMRVEHHAGNLAGVSTAYDELVRYLADLDAEPSSTTVDLWRSLLRPVQA